MSKGANIYGLDEKVQEKKMKIGLWLSLGVFALYILLGALTLSSSNILLPLILGGVCLLFGPITLIFYIIDVKRGVFRVDAEELARAEAEAAQAQGK